MQASVCKAYLLKTMKHYITPNTELIKSALMEVVCATTTNPGEITTDPQNPFSPPSGGGGAPARKLYI